MYSLNLQNNTKSRPLGRLFLKECINLKCCYWIVVVLHSGKTKHARPLKTRVVEQMLKAPRPLATHLRLRAQPFDVEKGCNQHPVTTFGGSTVNRRKMERMCALNPLNRRVT